MFWIKYFSYDSLILLKRVVALPYMNNYRIMHFYITFCYNCSIHMNDCK